jgi:hypothetical protein
MILFYYIFVHDIYVCLHFHFNLKLPPKKSQHSQDFRVMLLEQSQLRMVICKNLDSRSSWVFRLTKIGVFQLSTDRLRDDEIQCPWEESLMFNLNKQNTVLQRKYIEKLSLCRNLLGNVPKGLLETQWAVPKGYWRHFKHVLIVLETLWTLLKM